MSDPQKFLAARPDFGIFFNHPNIGCGCILIATSVLPLIIRGLRAAYVTMPLAKKTKVPVAKKVVKFLRQMAGTYFCLNIGAK
ncbi:hypothetical protein ACIPL1_03530 [Pseudomonas sp. NPDC090202]|uniref:hypothetical protein n=1 Tax=unclassified Pseudomonas TaxID=196821 RepID=UPI0037F195E1